MFIHSKSHSSESAAKNHLQKIKQRGGKGSIIEMSKSNFIVNFTFDTKRKEMFRFFDYQFDISKAYNLIQSGLIIFEIKDFKTYEMKHAAVDKEYSKLMSIDYGRAQGLVVKHDGKELLIDGSHRVNNAYLNGVKSIKVFYIENPKTIAKFRKKI